MSFIDEVRTALQRGNRVEARAFLAAIVPREPQNPMAWLLTAEALSDPQQIAFCHQKAQSVSISTTLVEQQEDNEMSKWEYAEISESKTMMGNPVYAWVCQNGQVVRLKGFEGQNKLVVALAQMGEQGWELAAAAVGIGDLGPETMRLFLKRPKQE